MNKTKINIIRDEDIIFTLYLDDSEQAKLFCKYFNNNISNIDTAVIED